MGSVSSEKSQHSVSILAKRLIGQDRAKFVEGRAPMKAEAGLRPAAIQMKYGDGRELMKNLGGEKCFVHENISATAS